jgi:hypothetical protein
MAGLDNIPQKQSVDIETVKLEESVVENVKNLNNEISVIVQRFGEIYIRRNEITEEMKGLEDLQQRFDDEFKAKNLELREFLDALDEKYPAGRINLQDGTITYQPGAPSRKQMQAQAENQAPKQVSSASAMKVVKE